MPVIIVILIISFLVIIHELGHFLAAKKAKITIEEFGLGYPPRIFKVFSHQGTDFTINLIPFGGFVKLEGENGQEQNLELQQSKKNKKSQSSLATTPFYTKTAKQKLTVILAGAVTNLIFSIIAFAGVYSMLGIPLSLSDQARIESILPDSPASAASLPTNVNIVEIRSAAAVYKIETFSQAQEIISQNYGQQITLLLTDECQGVSCPTTTHEYQVYVRTPEETPAGAGALGIAFQDVILAFYPWYEMPFRGTWYGLKQAASFGLLILQSLGGMISQLVTSGSVSRDIAGPVGIVYEAQQGNIISDNFWMNLGFAGMLSLNLAVINLLPIPALDGGRAFFILLQKIFGKKINKIELYANYAGFVLLLILIAAITISDISKIIH